MTLMEVLVAFLISALAISAMIKGYVFAAASTTRFSLSQAATQVAAARLEQVRSAPWVTSTSPAVDQLQATNFGNQVVTLDVTSDGSVSTLATNFVTIINISTNPPIRMIQVDCVWSYWGGVLLTNTLATCRAPNQ